MSNSFARHPKLPPRKFDAIVRVSTVLATACLYVLLAFSQSGCAKQPKTGGSGGDGGRDRAHKSEDVSEGAMGVPPIPPVRESKKPE